MNAHRFFAEGSILDPEFLHELAFQVFILILIVFAIIWLTYTIIKKYGSRLKSWQKILITLIVPFALIIIAGLVTQALGL